VAGICGGSTVGAEVVIRTPDRRLRVFVSSTVGEAGELAEERRVGLRTWPMLRRGETELVAQLRQALEADHSHEAFAAGARLNQREAVAAVRDRRGAGTAAP
jgi:hypothetical protein